MDNRIFKALICKMGKTKHPFPCICFCDRRVHKLGQSQEIICKSLELGRHQDSSVKMLEIHNTNLAAAFLPVHVLKHIFFYGQLRKFFLEKLLFSLHRVSY